MSTVLERLGQYEILSPLGSGGMGEVFVARDTILGRTVAIKKLTLKFTGDRDNLTRFTHEARSASALNHPNIVTIHEVGASAGTPYIVMEHVEGRDLRSVVHDAPLPNKQTLDMAVQIADGLAAAHDKAIVHRDLKPENVMLTKDGFVKILDFGLAKIIKPADEHEDTQILDLPTTNPGTILGTVGYMSPEQARGERIDFRSDQFALGAILYELATGKPAFDGETAIDVLSSILHDQPPPITRVNAQAPPPFCEIVERLLSKNPRDRYGSTRDLALDLRNVRDRFATLASSSLTPRPPRITKRRIAGASAIAIAIVASVIAFVLKQSRPLPAAGKRYLAVARFKDLSGDQTNQVVVDGLAETLTARLAHFPAVQVMRASTPDALTNANPQQIARDLGANVVVTGSMQRAGERVRVTYQVLDVARGGVERGGDLGSDLIEGSMTDLFAIQDRLADGVATALQLGAPAFRTPLPDTTISQRRYLEALGYLRRYDNETSVDSAIHILEELAASSSSASVQAALGRAYLYKFQLTHDAKWAVPATAACERAVAADAENPDVHVTLGELRRQTGKLDDAAREFNAALAQQPNNADAILGLAETHKGAGRLAEAEKAYKRAIELQPNYWGGYNKLGVFYFGHSRYSDAAEMFKKVVELLPDNNRGYNNLGSMYLQMGRYDDALHVFSSSIARQPSAQGYSNLGTANYFLGRYQDAANAFERATELGPAIYLYWLNLGDAYRWMPGAQGRANAAYDRAIELGDRELEVNSTDATIRARLAVALAKRGNTKRADDEIRLALAADPKNPSFMFKAAIIANVEGKESAALSWLDRALISGYSRSDVEHEREFTNLRDKGLLEPMLQRTATMRSGSRT
jgi:serine/threonine protein kinase/tetratricopeptide (TPR) repeat protein